MDPDTPPTEDFERWFYGGEAPAGDRVGELDLRAEEGSDCPCTRTAAALLDRLRSSTTPALAM